jgi:release factor glutamine methyltransferase
MMSARDLLRLGSGVLGSAAEARTLLAHASRVPEGELLLVETVAEGAEASFRELLAARAAGAPIQYLTGVAHFRTVTVAVGPGVFIPRPETEVLVGWALDRLSDLGSVPRVVELCAGSGAVSLAIATERPGCEHWAVEISSDALGYAERNLAGTGVQLEAGDMAEAFRDLDGTIDLVVANPPYIPLDAYEGVARDVRENEPTIALFSGADGLDAMRVVVQVASRLLRPGGWVAAEHAEVQSEQVVALFASTGRYTQVRDRRDLTGRPRFVTARVR